jgi:uncharacterized protein DUF4926
MPDVASTLVSRAVRLLKDIPELGLQSGEVGVVCSEWMAPTTAYEVEFRPATGMLHATRALLLGNQIQDVTN